VRYPVCEQLFSRNQARFVDVLQAIERLQPDLARFGGPPPAPRFEQDWFARTDLAACYAMIRESRPHRIVEIGSGHSTRVMSRAIRDGGINCELISIDPSPRARLMTLEVTQVQSLLSETHLDLFDELQAGDVLFIDSSHLAFPGTDVDIFFNVILPRAAAGTLIHIHDILLPDAYPAAWSWRGYNEQLLAATLLHTGAYVPIFASHFVVSTGLLQRHAPRLAAMPIVDGAFETSLWMRKHCSAIR